MGTGSQCCNHYLKRLSSCAGGSLSIGLPAISVRCYSLKCSLLHISCCARNSLWLAVSVFFKSSSWKVVWDGGWLRLCAAVRNKWEKTRTYLCSLSRSGMTGNTVVRWWEVCCQNIRLLRSVTSAVPREYVGVKGCFSQFFPRIFPFCLWVVICNLNTKGKTIF